MKKQKKILLSALAITAAISLTNCTRTADQDRTTETTGATGDTTTGSTSGTAGDGMMTGASPTPGMADDTAANPNEGMNSAGTTGGGYAASSSELETRVENAIKSDPAIKSPDDIEVSASGNQLTLEGKVSSKEEESMVLNKAKSIAGQTAVIDKLEVTGETE